MGISFDIKTDFFRSKQLLKAENIYAPMKVEKNLYEYKSASIDTDWIPILERQDKDFFNSVSFLFVTGILNQNTYSTDGCCISYWGMIWDHKD